MKIQKTIEYNVIVRAVLRDEELSLVMTVAAPYGNNNRTAGATIEDFSDSVKERVEKALQAVVKESLDKALIRADAAASDALSVAVRFGEE